MEKEFKVLQDCMPYLDHLLGILDRPQCITKHLRITD